MQKSITDLHWSKFYKPLMSLHPKSDEPKVICVNWKNSESKYSKNFYQIHVIIANYKSFYYLSEFHLFFLVKIQVLEGSRDFGRIINLKVKESYLLEKQSPYPYYSTS